MIDIYTLIMAGGSGTRFWPRSKTQKPKQFLNIFGNESLIQSTIRRFGSFTDINHIYIVSNLSQKEVLEEQTKILPKENLIYEPIGKNTLPCIGLAALYAEKLNPDGIMVVSPSDHLIMNDELFSDTIYAAADIADKKNGIVTIGITPDFPATGYGYVEVSEKISIDNYIKQFKVKRFVEKPDVQTATNYLNQGGFYWNSGIFIFKVSVFLNAIKEFAPELFQSLMAIKADMGNPTFPHTLNSIYREVEAISVDYGIMEKVDNIYLVEGNFEWNDLGSWDQVYRFDKKDDDGNVQYGEVILQDTVNSYAYTAKGLIALVGLEDVIVVQDGDTTLVCKRDKAEDIKKVVETIKNRKLEKYL